MESINFNCPHCQQPMEAPREMFGTGIDCPSCRRAITIPSQAEASAEREPVPATGTILPPPQRSTGGAHIKKHMLAHPRVAIPTVGLRPAGVVQPIAPPATRKCPFCAEDIMEEAVKCKFCGETLTTAGNSHGATVPPTRAGGSTSGGASTEDLGTVKGTLILLGILGGIMLIAWVSVSSEGTTAQPASTSQVTVDTSSQSYQWGYADARYYKQRMSSSGETEAQALAMCLKCKQIDEGYGAVNVADYTRGFHDKWIAY